MFGDIVLQYLQFWLYCTSTSVFERYYTSIVFLERYPLMSDHLPPNLIEILAGSITPRNTMLGLPSLSYDKFSVCHPSEELFSRGGGGRFEVK